jgi:hypothetical protein
MPHPKIRLGLPAVPERRPGVEGSLIEWRGGTYYRIAGHDLMEPFFTSLVSDSNLWMYLSSTGGLTAGRKDADHSLFPYETVDKLHLSHSHTGPRTVIRLLDDDGVSVWQPFAGDGRQRWELGRAVYKHVLGCEIWFEEVNLSLGLTFRYGWRPGGRFGWVRTAQIEANRETENNPVTERNPEMEPAPGLKRNSGDRRIEILDGVQNLLPAGVATYLQDVLSCLIDAYKSSECDPDTGLATFGLTSNISDRAEASEALRATVAWQSGLKNATVILDGTVWERFILGRELKPVTEHVGRRGSYLLKDELTLRDGETLTWHIALDTPVDQAGVTGLLKKLKSGTGPGIEAEISRGRDRLRRLLASADAFQMTGDPVAGAHHTANVLFNIGRGGVLPNQYSIDCRDFADFLNMRNRIVAYRHSAWLEGLPDSPSLVDLQVLARSTEDPDLIRLCAEYLPIVFSRRHGDPSRPWNRFSIVMQNPDGSPHYAYQGNWRDIFQNWEALCRSFPECLEPIIAKFVNASTVDGFNPYRITREGIDWEVADPEDPWSSIGYWGDHQIIYLLKLLEASRAHHPGALERTLSEDHFCYADVPYDIKPYEDIVRNPQDTITFNLERQTETDRRVNGLGSDGRLLHRDGEVLHVNLGEKLLVPILAKLSNLVPGGGIWLNTMRPEWNDANNALVGNGMSMVTACYLYRHLGFCSNLFSESALETLKISSPVADWLASVAGALNQCCGERMDDRRRREFLDAVGRAFSDYRAEAYSRGLSGRETVRIADIVGMLDRAREVVASTIRANRREDGLYHAYNLLHLEDGLAAVSWLQLMLEGQVAVLSSGLLKPAEAVALLDALRRSALYRDDQHTYVLYPVKTLPRYLEKNRVPDSILERSPSLAAMVESGDESIVARDADGQLRFNPDLANACVLKQRLPAGLPQAEVDAVLGTYEEVFHHKAFTGRSGTMYGYEGIGCIYWHMIGKLLLAVQEVFEQAVEAGEPEKTVSELRDHYLDIRAGMGFMKSPYDFGAFPLDPYSHTPAFAGARQPGMTGQVKEEILTRWGELGIRVHDGKINFRPRLLSGFDFLAGPASLSYVDTGGRPRALPLEAGSLGFTFCQVPVVYIPGDRDRIVVETEDGTEADVDGGTLPEEIAGEIFRRTGKIKQITVRLS